MLLSNESKPFNPRFELNGKKVYIAGIRGLVGSALSRYLKTHRTVELHGHSSKELNFRNYEETHHAIREINPDVLIIAAAKVGGIQANMNFPVDFINSNLEIQSNLLNVATQLEVNRVLFLGSSCIYPKFATQPIHESALLAGPLEETNRPYAIAKIAGLEQITAHRKQFGRKWISAMPCNLYGVGDYFGDQNGHVIPALLLRFHEAKMSGAQSVTAWGTGKPLREFLYIDDLAEGLIFALENYDDDSHFNIGSGREISIKDLTILVASTVGFTGEIIWDADKPDGTPRKILDVTKLANLGWVANTSIKDGLERTYKWMVENQMKIRR
jgi:GDP-L-fucose synthase